MKYLDLTVLLVLVSGCKPGEGPDNMVGENPVDIAVNPAIDLFSLISRLAGINQYKEFLLPDYITEVENEFGRCRDHPGIQFARKCNALHQIKGDAPMSLAGKAWSA